MNPQCCMEAKVQISSWLTINNSSLIKMQQGSTRLDLYHVWCKICEGLGSSSLWTPGLGLLRCWFHRFRCLVRHLNRSFSFSFRIFPARSRPRRFNRVIFIFQMWNSRYKTQVVGPVAFSQAQPPMSPVHVYREIKDTGHQFFSSLLFCPGALSAKRPEQKPGDVKRCQKPNQSALAFSIIH